MVASKSETGTVVVVDDDLAVLKTIERVLRGTCHVVPCTSAGDALWFIRENDVDVVVSDVSMPSMTGIELLRAVRAHDQDLPVVLITGRPSMESASTAMEHGVFRYLMKPLHNDQLRQTVVHAAKLNRLARIKREALALAGTPGASDRIGLEVSFQRALESLHVVFQPIVSLSEHKVYGYEALMRSAEPMLPGPAELLGAAERLGALFELGRLVRRWAAELFLGAAPDAKLFLNLHPLDLTDTELLDPNSPLAKVAHRTVLELTERASLRGIHDIDARVDELRGLGFRIAIDDLGAGFAGLSSFALLEPDTVKLDMTLVRDINQSPVKQKLVSSMASLCTEMHIQAVFEGIETTEERDTLLGLGCDLLQGHLFARPGPAFPEACF